MIKIAAFFPNYFKDFAIPHACYNIMKGMQSVESKIKLKGISSDRMVFNDDFYSDIIPQWSKSLVYKICPNSIIHNISETIFLKSLQDEDVVYLWPGVTLDAYKKVKSKGYKIIYEGVNTHEAHSKSILDAEYKRLNLPISHGVTAEKVIYESAKLDLSDYVYSCSPIMTASYLNNGIPHSKILQTSYGLSPRYIFDDFQKENSECITFIFVGSICVRKGVHLLLEYWIRAKLKAKLKLVGTIERDFEQHLSKYLGHENIEHVPFTNDLPAIYKKADVLILPSLEEGSPLVMYMALGAGLPVMVSPMAAGGVIVDNEDGFVIDAHDAEKWIEGMRLMAENSELRTKLSRKSKSKAQEYTWDLVAKKRLASLLQAINHNT